MGKNIPIHVAIIMDGNRRWAKLHGISAKEGHRQGVDTMMSIVEEASHLGVKYLTVYALSSENYKMRAREEINGLLNLISYGVRKYLPRLKKEKVKVTFLGDTKRLPMTTRLVVKSVRDQLSKNKRLNLNIAINYSSREEILKAAEMLSKTTSKFTEQNFEKGLYTAKIPDPDLLIRTGGQTRISNFLLWQISYSELYFTKTLWPDFGKKELRKAIDHYVNRKRNFGV